MAFAELDCPRVGGPTDLDRVGASRVETARRVRIHELRDIPDELRAIDWVPRSVRFKARELDKAATKGVIHANNAANKKSRMAKRLASL